MMGWWRRTRPKGSRPKGSKKAVSAGGWGSGTGCKEHGPQSLQHPKLRLEVWGPAGRASQVAASSPGTGTGFGIQAPSPMLFLCDGGRLRSTPLCPPQAPQPQSRLVWGDQAIPPCPKGPTVSYQKPRDNSHPCWPGPTPSGLSRALVLPVCGPRSWGNQTRGLQFTHQGRRCTALASHAVREAHLPDPTT